MCPSRLVVTVLHGGLERGVGNHEVVGLSHI